MNSLFGIPTSAIMVVMVALFAACVASVALIFLSNRTMFRMGLRNIPRRGTQTGLVVTGLMLATLIITAAFTTGDTINYSFTKGTYDTLQRTDISLDFGGEGGDGARGYVSEGLVPTLESRFAGDADIEGFVPLLREKVPALNPRTRLTEPVVTLTGIDPQRQARFGGLRLVDGTKADLAGLGEGQALVSKTTADKLDVVTGDTLTIYAQDREWTLSVAGIVEDQLASGVGTVGGPDEAGGLAVTLPATQRITGHAGQVNFTGVALKGDVRSSVTRTDAAKERLDAYFGSAEGKQAVGLGDLTVKVDPLKQDAVEQAETFSAIFTSVFLVLGLFSIAAGIMLIFMIFVMLASERKTEMGMARAVGAQRRNLVQMFVSEGMSYNLIAGAIGAALGVGAAFLLVVVGIKTVVGDEASLLTAHVTPRSLIISYCLGAVLTFITVVISSMRVSRLNIVAAVRGVDDVQGRELKRRTRWLWVALGIPALVVPPLGLYLLLRKGFGLPQAWVWGPIGILAGGLLILMGLDSKQQFFFSMGVSLLPLAVAGLVRYYGASSRATWSTVGGLLALYWLTPSEVIEQVTGKMSGNIEMFVLSGIMIVIGLTLLLVFNARMITGLFTRGETGHAYAAPAGLALAAAASVAAGFAIGDRGDGLGQIFYMVGGLLLFGVGVALAAARFPRFAPALKMGVAYPVANRFRTGMTIAMFSLIVFSIVVMSTLTANFSAMQGGDEAKGGWDIIAQSSRTNPVPDLVAALQEEGSFNTRTIAEAARVTPAEAGSEVRQPGRETWERYPVRAGDDRFFAVNQTKLDMKAKGYDSDRAVYEAVRTTPGLAVMDSSPIPNDDLGGGDQFKLKGIKSSDKSFEPFQVEFRDPVTGQAGTLTVIGVFSFKLPFQVIPGFFVNAQTFTPVLGAPDARDTFIRLTPGTDGETAAKGIKAAMLTKGVRTIALQERIDVNQAQSKGFTRIFQLFMGLGLFVGIAALGVIAFRSVVERRQQIGMLRAIGYQRGTVALTFLFESSFIALMGILSGVVGAAVAARNLMTSDSFTGTSTSGFEFFIPWGEVIAFVVIAYVFSLLLTWWPSRGAAKVPVAEALRYE